FEPLVELSRHARLARAGRAHEYEQPATQAHAAVEPRDRIPLRGQLDVEILVGVGAKRILGEPEVMQVLHAIPRSLSQEGDLLLAARRRRLGAARRWRRRGLLSDRLDVEYRVGLEHRRFGL